MEGKTFRDLTGGYERTDEGKDMIKNTHMFRRIAKHLRVLARSSPTDKYILVTGLRNMGHVVAVTGDGTNDAPALSRADVGLAMGTGSEAAKDASKIVLTKDDFCTVEIGVMYGRNIYDSVRKFLQFQLTVTFAGIVTLFIGAAVFNQETLTAAQILWVNLIMDTFGALALATEKPTVELMKREPPKRGDSIISAAMWRNIICIGIWEILMMLIILIWGATIFDLPVDSSTPF